jgi:hypothetical protein
MHRIAPPDLARDILARDILARDILAWTGGWVLSRGNWPPTHIPGGIHVHVGSVSLERTRKPPQLL